METLIVYLLKVSASLIIFYPFYLLLLRRNTFYILNRYFLIGSLLLSFVFPFISFTGTPDFIPSGVVYVLGEVTVLASRAANHAIPWQTGVFSSIAIVYFTGFLLLLVMFLQNMIRIIKLRNISEKVSTGGINVFIVNHTISSFSFGRWIFIDRDNYETDQYQIVLNHELAHVRQYHTFDLVMVEVLKALLWFHPVIWLYKRLFQEIHEYLADDAVISHGTEPVSYMQLLYKQSCDIHPIPISNHFNHSLIKRRFTMITKMKSGRFAALRIAVLLPLVTVVCFVIVNMLSFSVFSQKEQMTFVPVQLPAKDGEPQKEKKDKKVYTKVEKMPEYPGGYEVFQKYIGGEIKYPELAKKWGIGATVYVSFVVDELGNVITVETKKIKSFYADEKGKKAPADVFAKAIKDIEAEALRVIRSTPAKWMPGEEKGKKVAVTFTLPISFKLK